MPVEIERKFLVRDEEWKAGADAGREMRQGYLAVSAEAVVRIRLTEGEDAKLCVKGAPEGLRRPEFEYAVPEKEARELLRLCGGRIVEKRRHRVAFGGRTWEVDVFGGRHAGLTLAEIELESEDEPFARPPWLGEEVSGDPRYLNVRLATR